MIPPEDRTIFKVYVVCTPGLETITKGELQELELFSEENVPIPGRTAGNVRAAEETGGIEGHGTLQDVYRANLNLRTATRILVTIGRFPVRAFPALRQKAVEYCKMDVELTRDIYQFARKNSYLLIEDIRQRVNRRVDVTW